MYTYFIRYKTDWGGEHSYIITRQTKILHNEDLIHVTEVIKQLHGKDAVIDIINISLL